MSERGTSPKEARTLTSQERERQNRNAFVWLNRFIGSGVAATFGDDVRFRVERQRGFHQRGEYQQIEIKIEDNSQDAFIQKEWYLIDEHGLSSYGCSGDLNLRTGLQTYFTQGANMGPFNRSSEGDAMDYKDSKTKTAAHMVVGYVKSQAKVSGNVEHWPKSAS